MAARIESFRWRELDRHILRAAVWTCAASVVVKVVATGKEFAVARAYGRSDAMDAFLAASLIPSLLINLIAESMNQALIPTFVRVRATEGRRQSEELLAHAMFWLCMMLVAASLVMALGARFYFPVLAWHFDAEKLRLSERMFYVLLPVIVMTGIASNFSAVLNTFGRFTLPALAPVLMPLAIIACVAGFSGRFGIWTMVYATVTGSLLYVVSTLWLIQREGVVFRVSWGALDNSAREVVKQYGPVLLSSVVASGGLLVDQAMAAALSAGSLSTLAYANRFVSVVVTLLAGAVATAVTPAFSSMVAQRDWKGCESSVHTWVAAMAAVTVPVTAGLVLGARGLIQLTFEHGNFGRQDTHAVAPVLAMYALQIPFFVCSRVYYRFLLAVRRTDLIFYCGALNLLLDIVLNLLFMRVLGVAGIALATSVWSVSTFIFLWYWSRRLLGAELGVTQ